MTWLADILAGWKVFAPPNTERPGRAAFYARRRVRREKRRRLRRLVGASLFGVLAACVNAERRPCERLQHHDSTGHVVLCDCSCGDDPRFACPANVVECTRPELLDDEWRWPDESSSEGGSSDGR